MQTSPYTGTVSHATMNPAHLIPCFLAEARSLASTDAERAQLDDIKARTSAPGYYDGEDAAYDLEELFDMLDNAALARALGWTMRNRGERCTHPGTDGTVSCPGCGRSAGSFIMAARDWLDSRDGRGFILDPYGF